MIIPRLDQRSLTLPSTPFFFIALYLIANICLFLSFAFIFPFISPVSIYVWFPFMYHVSIFVSFTWLCFRFCRLSQWDINKSLLIAYCLILQWSPLDVVNRLRFSGDTCRTFVLVMNYQSFSAKTVPFDLLGDKDGYIATQEASGRDVLQC